MQRIKKIDKLNKKERISKTNFRHNIAAIFKSKTMFWKHSEYDEDLHWRK